MLAFLSCRWHYLRLGLRGIVTQCHGVPLDVVEAFLAEGVSVGAESVCF